MKKRIAGILFSLIALSSLFIFLLFLKTPGNKQVDFGLDDQLYGITVDDSWYDSVELDDIVAAIEDMPVKPIVRIVMSNDTEAKDYVDLFKRLHQVAYIMACPVDSYDMNQYDSVISYQRRFEDSFSHLSDYTDIWEIGNEVNGLEWIQQENSLITSKLEAAYQTIVAAGGQTALTFYYEKPNSQKSMFNWIEENIPNSMRQGLDYSFISYYEDENDGFQPQWQKVFKQFQALFPDSRVGIGECGKTALNASVESKISMAEEYYSMPKYTENYIGGYFWWYWVQDCLPHQRNRIYKAINEHMK